MLESVVGLYPRTLYVWTKSDDKKLLKGISEDQSVLVLAEDLEREYVSVIKRLDELGLFHFDNGTEEWVEIMALGIGGVGLQVAIDWCNAAPGRIPYSEIEQMMMADFRAEFELARELGLTVGNFHAMADLTWLIEQSQEVKAGYAAAVAAVIDSYDIPTPTTLKNRILGIVPATTSWPVYKTTTAKKKTRAGTARRRTYGKSRTKSSYTSTKPRRASTSRRAYA